MWSYFKHDVTPPLFAGYGVANLLPNMLVVNTLFKRFGCAQTEGKLWNVSWQPYHWGLSSACASLFESPRTSSGRPGKGPGARAEGRRTFLCQHPGKAQHTFMHTHKNTHTSESKTIFLKWERASLVYTVHTGPDWNKCLQRPTCTY